MNECTALIFISIGFFGNYESTFYKGQHDLFLALVNSIFYQLDLDRCLSETLNWDQCYDFGNIFAGKKILRKICRFFDSK
jgi:hypothetical protein